MSDRRLTWGLALAGVGLSLAVVWRMRAVATPFVLALVLAYLLEPLVSLLERREVPRGPAILTVYLMLAVAVTLLWMGLVPAIVAEVENLAQKLPQESRRWDALFTELARRVRLETLPDAVRRAAETAISRIEGLLAGFASRLAGVVVATVSQALNLVLTPILAYYILKDRERLAESLLSLVPRSRQRRAVGLALEVDQTLAAVIRGQLLVSMSVGMLVAAGLVVLGVPYALVLGLLTGVVDIVPYFGPVVAAVPIVALALTKSPWTAAWALGLLVLANQVEGAFLQPRVMSRNAGLHPLVVIGSVLAGAELLGILGMLLAVPIASVARAVLAFFLRGGPAGREEGEIQAGGRAAGHDPRPGPPEVAADARPPGAPSERIDKP